MPSLDWIGKKAVVNHHKQVPFHLLRGNEELSFGDPGSGNLLVQGDNLLALKALLPYYAGEVKCIYIDPPYNTGVDERDESGKRSGWVYNDNVSSPEIKDWLFRVVGAEAEDLSRHDKWLCMMYPRLSILYQFLKEDGVVFASIDEVEFANLRLLFDEIFGISNRVGTIIWDNATDNNPTNIAVEHEYILCYAKNKSKLASVWKSQNLAVKEKLLEIGNEYVKKYPDQNQRQEAYTKWFRDNKEYLWPFDRYKFIDDDGIYTGSQSVHNPGKEGYRYDVPHPTTGRPCKEPLMGYRFPPETMERLRAEQRLIFGKDEAKLIELKVYVSDYRAKLSSLFTFDGRVGTNEIKEILHHDRRPFDFPKPTALLEELFSFTTSKDDLILDSFAGSGTTGHAILKLNKADGQKRRFVLVEMKDKIAKDITAERLKRVSNGYVNAKNISVKGLGGGFRFCELGETLFDADGFINRTVTFKELAHHVFFVAIGEPLPSGSDLTTPLIGTSNNTAVYLLYNGILGDSSDDGGNVLSRDVLAKLPKHDGLKIVYGNGCLLGPTRLNSENIIFRQIPYEVKLS
ncbi:site-specific DNA-methyltransferase [Chlorobium sp. BLA1]|uniref:site-specific DNA-methyltransferase n=1 Tax=Candidatus Chlorobium masyuteum TaxID=2716876 RepID=UPI001422C27B|nr:site-specific DNA-methyltransferase [Candidatus Chlorobium masyuteum]NHQ59729.1 site-specific DNA-methyltransferase [Candidatus Chlorobium masyuteum]